SPAKRPFAKMWPLTLPPPMWPLDFMAGLKPEPAEPPVKRTRENARRPERILIVTDAWSPQINGVVRTLETLGRELIAMGHQVLFATPENHTTLPLPTYPEIR